MLSFTIVIIGLSITSSWGNGHATTYRALVRELTRRGHKVIFLERDVPWYAAERDLPRPPYGQTYLYRDLDQLRTTYANLVERADLVIVGSYVPEGVAVGRWVMQTAQGATAFYDIDTPVTAAKLVEGDEEYLSLDLVPQYDLYLSFTGGPLLERIEREFGARMARVLYCSVDPELHYPERVEKQWDLGYLGTYSEDRQPKLESLLTEPARILAGAAFAVAGPQYPLDLQWPENVTRFDHLPPEEHRAFYNSQRFTLNVTRVDMVRAGWSPSVRLFEAAACGTPIISDHWDGIESLFVPDDEILIARSAEDVVGFLCDIPEERRREIGAAARRRVLEFHTASKRAAELESYAAQALGRHTRFVRSVPTSPAVGL